MPGEHKASVLEEFRSGGVRLLVASTVVEVGVDVPEASIMLVEHADRWGVRGWCGWRGGGLVGGSWGWRCPPARLPAGVWRWGQERAGATCAHGLGAAGAACSQGAVRPGGG
jgi:hypothetical protein